MTTDTLTIDSDVSSCGNEAADAAVLNPPGGFPSVDSAVGHLQAENQFAGGVLPPDKELAPQHNVSSKDLNLSQLCRDLIELTKPRIVVMILVTTVATALVGAGESIALVQLFWLLLGTGSVAASAGAANQIWERRIDRKMTRTASRPISAGRFSWKLGWIYAGLLGALGVGLLNEMFSLVPAAIGAATWFVYVLVYTPMKTRTAWNTTVGAVAGALPMLIGYTASGGSLTDTTGWLLVGILVAWQYPHFMAIAWMYRGQYSEAGFQMATTVDPTGKNAGVQSIAGSIVLILCAIGLCCMKTTVLGGILAVASVIVSWPMLKASMIFAKQPNDEIARSLLRRSLLVLPLVLGIVTVALVW